MKAFSHHLPFRIARSSAVSCLASKRSSFDNNISASFPISRFSTSKPNTFDAPPAPGDCLSDPMSYIKPSSQDFLLLDVDFEELKKVAVEMKVEYLKEAVFSTAFPVSGIIWGPNRRLMVNLVCRRVSKDCTTIPINVIFLIDTGSPFTHLCVDAYQALIGEKGQVPETMRVQIQSEVSMRTFLSPINSHFSNVNVLGMDFLSKERLSIITNFLEEDFFLNRIE